MEYKLAKQLKDAGFPQFNGDGSLKGNYQFPDGVTLADKNMGEKAVFFPTLSELIEACGDDFDDLRRHVDNGVVSWSAREWEMGGRYGEGSTAEEATAKLYLALHPTDT